MAFLLAISLLVLTTILFLVWTKMRPKESKLTGSPINQTIASENQVMIVGSNDQIKITGSGAVVQNKQVTITESGTYTLQGTINSSIIIEKKNIQVKLVLDNVTIKSSENAAIWVKKAQYVEIEAKADTVNQIEDTTNYPADTEENDVDGTIFSKSDLCITGSGSLKVSANYQDGIVSKDNLKIENTNVEVISKDDGIRGKDSLVIKNSNIMIDAKADGMKSTNETETDKGYVLIQGGVYQITTLKDGIVAQTTLQIDDGTFQIQTGGGSGASASNQEFGMGNQNKATESAKGLKAGKEILIKKGNFIIDSLDDSIHSNDKITISNGTYRIQSGDDGIHADDTILIENGVIEILKSCEGIEAVKIEIQNGKIAVVADDDGINGCGGNDGSAMGRPGANAFSRTGNAQITINGGTIQVNASGDGVDSNGSITMNDGFLIVNGPTDNGNGALDYDSEFQMNGGTLIAVGSSGMMQATSNDSKQYTIASNFSTQPASTPIYIEDQTGDRIILFQPEKAYSSLVISTPDLKQNETYSIYIGGTVAGTGENGIYSDLSQKGTLIQSVTLNNKVTMSGTQMGPMGPGGMREPRR